MRKFLFAIVVTIAMVSTCWSADTNPSAEPDPSVMSEGYYRYWNEDVQKAIDERIEKFRKADAKVELIDVKPGTEIKVEQLTHQFIFGAHIFNFNQLGSTELNNKYKNLYGTLFNSATIAFYWKTLEPEPGKIRFETEQQDTEEFWNNVKEPTKQPHWRRPSIDQVVEFCKSKGIRLHGHPIIWGHQTFQRPAWMWDYYSKPHPEEREAIFKNWNQLKTMTPEQRYNLAPKYFDSMTESYWNRIRVLAQRYKGTIDSWDVVNESAVDYHGKAVTGDKVQYSKMWGHSLPGDYTYNSFMLAQKLFPESVKLNINDYIHEQVYADQVKDLIEHGAKIDIVGVQMHLFDANKTREIAEGKAIRTPEQILKTIKMMAANGRPIHISEVTVAAPSNDAKGFAMQAIAARNLYRLWFSIPEIMGVTWWNVVDECGVPNGDPKYPGLFTRNMEPKPWFFALNKLINEDWKTNFTQQANGESVTLQFRGFKGKYKATWTDKNGNTQTKEFVVE